MHRKLRTRAVSEHTHVSRWRRQPCEGGDHLPVFDLTTCVYRVPRAEITAEPLGNTG